MNFNMTSSDELQSCIERAHELRREYISQQLRLGRAALNRLIHGSWQAASAAVSANPQRDLPMIMR